MGWIILLAVIVLLFKAGEHGPGEKKEEALRARVKARNVAEWNRVRPRAATGAQAAPKPTPTLKPTSAFKSTLTPKPTSVPKPTEHGIRDFLESLPPEVNKQNSRSKLPSGIRADVLRRDKSKCQHCGRQAPDVEVHVDHKVPASKGGATTLNNLQVLCADCNRGKGNRFTG